MTDFRQLPDLAARSLGGAVVAADDEFFAAKENLVRDAPPAARDDFGHKGKEYDGWETRRRRSWRRLTGSRCCRCRSWPGTPPTPSRWSPTAGSPTCGCPSTPTAV